MDGFRFDLASTLARELHDVDRLVGVLRPHPAGPGDQPGEADRRAVGRRRGRLSGRQLPAALVGVERQVPRLGARLLARHRSDARRVRATRFTGSSDLYAGQRPPAVRQHQLRHRARRLHAARSRVVQREAQRGQRRGQPRRREPQPLVELRRRRADRRPGRSSRCARGRSATSWRRCFCRRACRCCSAATRSAARSSGNNNAYCQDNEISWFDWEHADTEPAASSRSDLIRLRREHPGVPPPPLVPGAPDPRQRRQRHRLVHARRAPRCRTRTGRPASPSRSACS